MVGRSNVRFVACGNLGIQELLLGTSSVGIYPDSGGPRMSTQVGGICMYVGGVWPNQN